MFFRKISNALIIAASIFLRFFILVLMLLSAWLFWRGIADANGQGNEIAAVAGVIPVTIAAVLWSVYQHWEQGKEKSSQFYLEQYIDGVELAYSILKRGNDRVEWNSGARILGACEMLEEKITERHHKRILEMKKDQYRPKFHDIIQGDTRKPSFFYGVDENIAIDQAAIDSTVNQMTVGSADEYNPLPYTTELIEEAVRMVWRFAAYPDDYKDVLSEKFSDKEEDKVRKLFPAVYFWLKHRKRFRSNFGVLHENKIVKGRSW